MKKRLNVYILYLLLSLTAAAKVNAEQFNPMSPTSTSQLQQTGNLQTKQTQEDPSFLQNNNITKQIESNAVELENITENVKQLGSTIEKVSQNFSTQEKEQILKEIPSFEQIWELNNPKTEKDSKEEVVEKTKNTEDNGFFIAHIKEALKNTPEYEIEKAELTRAKIGKYISAMTFLPTANFNLSKSVTDAMMIQSLALFPMPKNSWSFLNFTLSASQDLSFYKKIPEFLANLLQIKAQYSNYFSRLEAISSQVVDLYLDYITKKKLLEIKQRIKKLAETKTQIAQVLKSKNIITQNKLDLTEIEAMQAQNGLDQAVDSLNEAAEFYTNTTKKEPREIKNINTGEIIKELKNSYKNIEDYENKVKEKNNQLTALKLIEKAKSTEVVQAWNSLLPDLELRAGYMQNNFFGSPYHIFQFTLDLNFAIFDGGRAYEKIIRKITEKTNSISQSKIAQNKITSTVKKIWSNKNALLNTLKMQEKLVSIQQRNFETQESFFKHKQSTKLDLLSAAIDLEKAKQELLQTEFNLIKLFYQMKNLESSSPFVEYEI